MSGKQRLAVNMNNLNIQITDNLKRRLESLSSGYHGKALFEYLDILMIAIQDLSTMNKDNFEGRQQAKEILQEYIIDFLKNVKIKYNESDDMSREFE